jgi:hypothetical protein
MMRPGTSEWFLPFRYPRGQTPETTHFRSTWIASSLKSMREHGYFDRWSEAIEPKYRDIILQSVAGTWLPVEVAVAHYRAYSTLNLAPSSIVQLGHEVQHRVNSTVLSTVVRLSKSAGVTPWLLFSHYQRLWDRVWMGGDIAVEKLGPKEAVVECVGCTLAASEYYRLGFRGVHAGLAEMFCTKVYVSEERGSLTPTSVRWRVAWA